MARPRWLSLDVRRRIDSGSDAHLPAFQMREVRSLHVAFVYNSRGVLLSTATNRQGKRELGAGYSKYTIHAERAALKLVGDTSLLKGATLVVVRIGSTGEYCSSLPCDECKKHILAAMKKYGLKRVMYS